MLHVTKAKYLSHHQVYLEFNDGTQGEADLAGLLDGPIFHSLRDVEYFAGFKLEGHTLAWDNGADFAPEFLHDIVHAKASTR